MDQRSTNGRLRRVIQLDPPIYAIYGSDGDGSSKPPDPDKKPDAQGDGEPGSGESAAPPPAATVSADEYAALQRRMQAADRAKTAAEQRVAEFEAANATELEKAIKRAEEAEAKLGEAEKRARDAQIHSEVLKLPGYEWHDADALLKLIDLDGVEVGEDGKITGVKEAVKALASKAPYLLKATDDKSGDKKDKKDQKPPDGPPSGHQPGTTPPDGAAAKREELLERYPQLQR